MGEFPKLDPKELEKNIDVSAMVQVWTDTSGDDVDLYYINPMFFIPREAYWFYDELRYHEENKLPVKESFWEIPSRYKEAVDRYIYWRNYFSDPKNKNSGFS